MRPACLYVNHFFANDEIFNAGNPVLNQNNQLEPYRRLKEAFARRGYELRTQDFHSPAASDVVLYADMPKALPRAVDAAKSYLLIFETQLIVPANWKERSHARFKKIFTWSEEKIREDRRYVKFNFPQPMPWPESEVGFEPRTKLCCLISGGKLSLHPKELYSERIRWIKWFEKNHPQDFDLFGSGWERMWMTGPLWIRAINKLPIWRRILYPPFKSNRGRIADKFEVMENYKFAICLENARDIEGYITEKIFDCFFAGCITLYWGAPDIADKIPADCFIDLRKFSSKEQVYELMSRMSQHEFEGYQQRIRAYLKSPKFKPFTSEFFAETIVRNTID
jgi:hypothetical protein